jgi:hypothetical protein
MGGKLSSTDERGKLKLNHRKEMPRMLNERSKSNHLFGEQNQMCGFPEHLSVRKASATPKEI